MKTINKLLPINPKATVMVWLQMRLEYDSTCGPNLSTNVALMWLESVKLFETEPNSLLPDIYICMTSIKNPLIGETIKVNINIRRLENTRSCVWFSRKQSRKQFLARGRFPEVFSRKMNRKGVIFDFPEAIPEAISREWSFPGSLFPEVKPEGGHHSEHTDFRIYWQNSLN